MSPKLEMKVVTEKEASPFRQVRFEVVPRLDRNEDYVEPIICNTMDADVVIVHLVSQKAVLERLGIPSEKIHVIAHGTLLSNSDKKISRARLKLPEEGRIMLMFGFVKPYKCVHVGLEVLKEVKARKSAGECMAEAGA